jgi:hypothetical protein
MSLVKSALIEEFKDLAAKSIDFKKKIDTAKTFAKKEIYKKKLRDNNIKAAEILAALEKVANAEAGSKKEAVGAIDETLSDEGRIEAPVGDEISLG